MAFVIAAFELTGLGRGGAQVQKCKDTYQKALEALVDIASLQVMIFLYRLVLFCLNIFAVRIRHSR